MYGWALYTKILKLTLLCNFSNSGTISHSISMYVKVTDSLRNPLIFLFIIVSPLFDGLRNPCLNWASMLCESLPGLRLLSPRYYLPRCQPIANRQVRD